MLTHDDARAIEAQIPALRRYARALVRDAEAADDLVQDCLERAVARFSQFRPGTNLRTWLFTILHNVHCDGLRRRRRQGVHVPLEEWEPSARAPANQRGAAQLRDFRRAFDTLAESDRQILLLVGLEGFSYEEASQMLDLAVGTVKSRLFRARERLRAIETAHGEPRIPSQPRAAA